MARVTAQASEPHQSARIRQGAITGAGEFTPARPATNRKLRRRARERPRGRYLFYLHTCTQRQPTEVNLITLLTGTRRNYNPAGSEVSAMLPVRLKGRMENTHTHTRCYWAGLEGRWLRCVIMAAGLRFVGGVRVDIERTRSGSGARRRTKFGVLQGSGHFERRLASSLTSSVGWTSRKPCGVNVCV